MTVATVWPEPPPNRLPMPPPMSAPPMPPTPVFTFCTVSCVIEITVPTRAVGSDTWKAGGVLHAASSSTKAALHSAAARRQKLDLGSWSSPSIRESR